MGDGCRVYIGNLDPAVSQDEVDQECRRFGKLSSVWVARNPPGFSFVVSVRRILLLCPRTDAAARLVCPAGRWVPCCAAAESAVRLAFLRFSRIIVMRRTP